MIARFEFTIFWIANANHFTPCKKYGNDRRGSV